MGHLKSHTGKFFEVSAKMGNTQEDGTIKTAKHTVVVEAETFGDAEFKAIEEFTGSDVDVVAVGIAPYKEVFTSETEDEKFFRAKLAFITIDEKSGKEKRTTTLYLVQADSLAGAVRNVDSIMRDTMIDYDSISVTASPVEQAFCQ